MRKLLLAGSILMFVSVAHSDVTHLEGGVLIAHHPPRLRYSQGEDWCLKYYTDYPIEDCDEQNPRIDLDGNRGESSVWYVLAAWAESKSWCETEFGFGDFNSEIYDFIAWGPCGPDVIEIATDSWPGPEEGTAVATTGTAWSGNLTPVYYFAGYAYSQGQIPLGANPATAVAGTCNCLLPPGQWQVSQLGSMGVFEDGVAVCPEGMLDAGQEDSGRDSAERDSGGGSDQGERSVLYVCPTADQYATIRAAIQAASDGDTIELCCGIPFTGEGNRNIESEGKSLTIRSSCAIADSCVLDCEGRLAPPNSARRAFLFERGDNVLITGLTVYDGKAYAPPDSG